MMTNDRDNLLQEYCRTRSEELFDRVCELYLPLAAAIARRFSGRGVEYDDLFQVASMALVKALRRFDPDRGVQFSTYVTPTIVGEVKNYFRDRARLIALPRRSGALLRAVEAAREKMTQELSRSPTAEELARELGESVETVLETLEMQGAAHPISLDAPLGDDAETTVSLLLGEEDEGYRAIERRDLLERVFAGMTADERLLLQKRFFENMSQRDVAMVLGVSQMTVSRMEKKALEKARHMLEDS